jgi:Ca-activated chloride channel homolog
MLPMAALIVVMYILKLRRKDVVVSSTWLWSKVIRDVQANAPFQKLRKNLLLLLQLIAILLLVLLLARPYWRGRGLGGRSVVIVVDNSASMGAKDTGSSRLDEAKREAMKVVNDIRAEDQMMVLSAGARPESMTGFTADRTELARAIDRIRQTETITNMRDAVNLAAALVSARNTSVVGQIDIVSDGAFPPITGVDLGKALVRFHTVGKRSDNVGIAAVDYRRSLVGEKTVEVFVTVRNFSDKPRTFNVELLHEKTTRDARELTLPPRGEDSDIFELPEPSGPIALDINLDAKDDMEADNRASLVISPRKIVKALLVTPGNVFLENGIKADPNVELTTGKPGASPAGYDVVIYDGTAPAKLPDGNYLFVNCTSNQAPVSPLGEVEEQGLIDPNRNHPVLRYVDFGSLRWTKLRYGKAAGWGQELATSESGAAIVAGEKGKMRAVWTGFEMDLAHSQFPILVAYPIFISNTIRWLARADDAGSGSLQLRTGTPVTIDAPASAKTLVITKPHGEERILAVPPRGGVVFDDTDEVGIYKATGEGGFQRVYAANLASFAESDIAPVRRTDVGATGPGNRQPGKPVTVVREVWPWIAVVLLALLGLEWWAFHRRVYVT